MSDVFSSLPKYSAPLAIYCMVLGVSFLQPALLWRIIPYGITDGSGGEAGGGVRYFKGRVEE